MDSESRGFWIGAQEQPDRLAVVDICSARAVSLKWQVLREPVRRGQAEAVMEPATTPLANGTRFEDRYEIQGELGSGSFGRVYQARQLSTGQSVAIKVLSPRQGTEQSSGREVERFRRELRANALRARACRR